MAFVLQRTLKLDEFEGWDGCFITLSEPKIPEVEALAKLAGADGETAQQLAIIKKIITDHFVEGVGWDGKEKTPITKDTIADLPYSIYMRLVTFLLASSSLPNSGLTATSE